MTITAVKNVRTRRMFVSAENIFAMLFRKFVIVVIAAIV